MEIHQITLIDQIPLTKLEREIKARTKQEEKNLRTRVQLQDNMVSLPPVLEQASVMCKILPQPWLS